MAEPAIDIGFGSGGVSVGTQAHVLGANVSFSGTIPVGGSTTGGGAPVGGGPVAVRYSSNPRSHGFTLVQRYSPQGGLWRNDTQRTLYITDQVSQFEVKPGGQIQQMATGQILPGTGAASIAGPPSFQDAMNMGQGTTSVEGAKNAAGNAASARDQEKDRAAAGLPADQVQTSKGIDTTTILLVVLVVMAMGGGASRRRK